MQQGLYDLQNLKYLLSGPDRKSLPTSGMYSMREMCISSNNMTLSLLLAKSSGFIMLKRSSLLVLVPSLLRFPCKTNKASG